MRTTLIFLTIVLSLGAGEPDAEALIRNGHWKRARETAEAAYRQHPDDARAAALLSRVRREFHDVDEAVKLAETAVKRDPKSAANHRALAEALEDQVNKLAIFKQLGQSRRIRAELDAALALAPKDPDNLADQIDYLAEAPGIAGGDKKKAAEVANELVKIDGAKGYLALANLARAQKENDRLEGLYRKAVEANPLSYEARIALAVFYTDPAHQNYSAVEREAAAAMEVNPDRIGAYRWLAFAQASQKRVEDAAKLLARAEAAVPDDLSPYVYAARALLRDGVELPKSEAWLRKYFTETKEPEPGAPFLAGAHWSLALVYEKEHRLTDARSELQTALKLKPDFEPAKKDLQRLK